MPTKEELISEFVQIKGAADRIPEPENTLQLTNEVHYLNMLSIFAREVGDRRVALFSQTFQPYTELQEKRELNKLFRWMTEEKKLKFDQIDLMKQLDRLLTRHLIKGYFIVLVVATEVKSLISALAENNHPASFVIDSNRVGDYLRELAPKRIRLWGRVQNLLREASPDTEGAHFTFLGHELFIKASKFEGLKAKIDLDNPSEQDVLFSAHDSAIYLDLAVNGEDALLKLGSQPIIGNEYNIEMFTFHSDAKFEPNYEEDESSDDDETEDIEATSSEWAVEMEKVSERLSDLLDSEVLALQLAVLLTAYDTLTEETQSLE